jgi:hypothetical protein
MGVVYANCLECLEVTRQQGFAGLLAMAVYGVICQQFDDGRQIGSASFAKGNFNTHPNVAEN